MSRIMIVALIAAALSQGDALSVQAQSASGEERAARAAVDSLLPSWHAAAAAQQRTRAQRNQRVFATERVPLDSATFGPIVLVATHGESDNALRIFAQAWLERAAYFDGMA